MWLYLNPYRDDSVEKAATFDFMLMMMFNIGHLPEREMASLVAKYLITYYGSLDISLRTDNGEASSKHVAGVLQSSRTGGNTDLYGLSSSIHSLPISSGVSQPADTKSQQSPAPFCKEVELIHTYLLKRKNGWKVQQLL